MVLNTFAFVVEFQEVLAADSVALAWVKVVLSFVFKLIRVFATDSLEGIAVITAFLHTFNFFLREVTIDHEFGVLVLVSKGVTGLAVVST